MYLELTRARVWEVFCLKSLCAFFLCHPGRVITPPFNRLEDSRRYAVIKPVTKQTSNALLRGVETSVSRKSIRSGRFQGQNVAETCGKRERMAITTISAVLQTALARKPHRPPTQNRCSVTFKSTCVLRILSCLSCAKSIFARRPISRIRERTKRTERTALVVSETLSAMSPDQQCHEDIKQSFDTIMLFKVAVKSEAPAAPRQTSSGQGDGPPYPCRMILLMLRMQKLFWSLFPDP